MKHSIGQDTAVEISFQLDNLVPSPAQAYMYNDDDFNWNHGLSLGSTGNYKV